MNGNPSCNNCKQFLLHDTYDYLGICQEKGELVIVSRATCDDFEEVRKERIKKAIEEKGWVHCTSCKRPIYSLEELEEHSGDHISPEVYVDEVSREEAPCAD